MLLKAEVQPQSSTVLRSAFIKAARHHSGGVWYRAAKKVVPHRDWEMVHSMLVNAVRGYQDAADRFGERARRNPAGLKCLTGRGVDRDTPDQFIRQLRDMRAESLSRKMARDLSRTAKGLELMMDHKAGNGLVTDGGLVAIRDAISFIEKNGGLPNAARD
ncbi:MAG: hypothetical protein KGH69_04740 [Candidatus Micrarchaeota archaeon]|nr:hypothetical protein [Candidatus Micrarchaeota archaeon]